MTSWQEDSKTQVNPAEKVFSSFKIANLAISDDLRQELKDLVFGKPYPLLIIGDEGAGKHRVANALAASYLCENKDSDGSACGQCSSCRLLEKDSHFDLAILDPGPNGRLKVDELRSQVTASLLETPRKSDNKVYIISAEKPETLSETCQNALLKPLEDHPSFVRFILFCEDSDRLLPTIRSRVQTLRLGRRSDQHIKQILNEAGIKDESSRNFAITYADGLPGRALTLAQDDIYRDIYREALELFKAIFFKKRSFLLTEGVDFFKENKENSNLILRLFQSFLRELALAEFLNQTGTEENEIVNFSSSDLKKMLSGNQIDFASALSYISQTRHALAYNAQYDHTISRLLLKLQDAFVS